jgi:hypothetical protein
VVIEDYVISFGLSPEAFTTDLAPLPAVPGKQSFPLKDLIPGQTYYVRLAPRNKNREFLTELSTTGQGVPLDADGFVPDAGHDGPALGFPAHSGAPGTPGSGFPVVLTLGIAGMAGIGYWIWARRKRQLATQTFFRTMGKRYHS